MKRFIEGEDRNQSTLFPELLDGYIAEDNPVRVIDIFVDELEPGQLGFGRVEPKVTGWPACHPSMLLKLYIYGYLNRIQSSRRLERQAQRNVELIWLRRVTRWEHEAILEAMQDRLDCNPEIMRIRRQTVEHPYGTLKAWMGSTQFLTRMLKQVSAEMSLHVLAYNLKRVMSILGIKPLIQTMQA